MYRKYTMVEVRDDTVSSSADTIPEMKTAIKELRLFKKEIALQRKEVAAQQTALRADYRAHHSGPAVRGRGGFNRFLRGVQGVSKDAAKQSLDKKLATLEQDKILLDRYKAAADQVILLLERQILSNG